MNATPLGISAIAVHQPSWELDNSWFGEAMPRKFSHHTGIEARAISLDDEVTMGIAAVPRRNQNLRSTYHLCGELACTPSGGSGGHGH